MPARPVLIHDDVPPELADGLADLRMSLQVPDDFPAETLRAAQEAVRRPRLSSTDLTGIEFVTIDPPGAKDLDQAVHIAASGDGFEVSYAIADVSAFVAAGDPVDAEAHRRGQTFYAPHRRTPLHPPVLSEDAASLLAGQVRPALVWTLRLDSAGATVDARVERALVRSRAQLTYQQVQADLDAGSATESLALLRTVGKLCEEQERARGGVSLAIPGQEVEVADGSWRLAFRTPLPVEGWNAQISLATGMAAAAMMLKGRVGVLRTLPPADDKTLARLRTTAAALRIGWPKQLGYPEFVRGLDPGRPAHATMVYACTTLFRGAGYTAFDGSVPTQTRHAALAAEYAHTTAPLRRLVDRYVGETCVALCAGEPVPQWVRAALPQLPAEMDVSAKRAKKYERGIVDLVETLVLSTRVGQRLVGTVVNSDPDGGRGRIMIDEPAVEANIKGRNLKLGEEIAVVLASADVRTGVSVFQPVG